MFVEGGVVNFTAFLLLYPRHIILFWNKLEIGATEGGLSRKLKKYSKAARHKFVHCSVEKVDLLASFTTSLPYTFMEIKWNLDSWLRTTESYLKYSIQVQYQIP